MSPPPLPLAVVTDIEGTTTALSFVKNGLFPFARRQLPDFVARRRHDPEIRGILAETARESGKEPQDEDALVAQLLAWIDEDRKIAPLKSLQGLIWAEGYNSGELKGHIYPDAAQGLRRWHDAGIGIYIYSSGSVTAQQLIFGHSEHGDLTPLLSGYFDTRTGPKLESRSYDRITKAIGLSASSLLFLSDHLGELDAARAAGWRTAWLNRDNQLLPAGGQHPAFSDFTAIDPAALVDSSRLAG
jgi:enolase-phosphatase E1